MLMAAELIADLFRFPLKACSPKSLDNQGDMDTISYFSWTDDITVGTVCIGVIHTRG